MTMHRIAVVIGFLGSSTTGWAQFAARVVPAQKAPAVTTGASQVGGFLMGVDDCNSAHTVIPAGDAVGVPYTTGTTGSTGQNEATCLFFGLTGLGNDAWFDWQATMTGIATLDTCGNATDTKVAIYPLSTCPADGTSLACSDDSCGLQSAVSWNSTSGTTYTIQLGTFPGVPGGSGTLDIAQTGAPQCGQKDDGSTENSFGLIAGGEIGWLTVWDTGPNTCLATWDSIETAYGTLMFPGSVTNGAGSQVVVYHDADNDSDPRTGLTVDGKIRTVVVNGDTDILNKIPLPVEINKATDSKAWVLVSAEHIAGQFPGPMDQTPPTHAAGAWVVGSTMTAGFNWRYHTIVPQLVPLQPDDFHVTLTGAGAITIIGVTPVGISAVTNGNTIDVEWGAPLAAGVQVSISFVTENQNAQLVAATWTNNGNNVGGAIGGLFMISPVGTLNTTNLNANNVTPVNMAAIGFPTNWLVRVDDTAIDPPGTAVCFGDGSGTACPCGNSGGTGEGCANGTGGGGVLGSAGTPSVTADTFTLTANGVINNNGLFFQGNNTIAGGAGSVFGDGIRCCGGGVVRIQVVNPPGTTSPATAQMTETATTNGPNGTITPGTKKCYQFWYRDPSTSPCGSQFNLTNAVTATWLP